MNEDVFEKLKIIMASEIEFPRNVVIPQTVHTREPLWDKEVLNAKYSEAKVKIQSNESEFANEELPREKIAPENPSRNSSIIKNQINTCKRVSEICVDFLRKDASKYDEKNLMNFFSQIMQHTSSYRLSETDYDSSLFLETIKLAHTLKFWKPSLRMMDKYFQQVPGGKNDPKVKRMNKCRRNFFIFRFWS